MAITLKEVADLIKTGDAVQIKNQEDQGKTLDSIDKGIKKFLAVQERDRLDKLEDRREARKTRTVAGGGIAVAGGAAASSGGPSTMSRILTQGIGTALALGAYKFITAGFRGIKNTLAKSFGTQRGALLDINKSLTTELKNFQKVLKDDIKVLKAQQKALNNELKKAYVTESDLRRQIQAETKTFTEAGQQRMKALQARLDDAIARRQVLQTDLDSARADLSSARLDLKETRIALSESRAAGKLDAQALRNQVAALEQRVAGLRVGQIETEQAFADRAARLVAPNAQIGGLKVGDNIQYKTTTGKFLDAQVMDTAGGKVQLKSGSNIFAVDAQNLADRTNLPGYGEARVPPLTIQEALRSQGSLLNPFARGTRLNNFLRIPGMGDPFGIAEAGAATSSRVAGALGMSRTAAALGTTSATLSSLPFLVLSLSVTPFNKAHHTELTSAILKVVDAFKNNDISAVKLARQKVKEILNTKYSGMTIAEFANGSRGVSFDIFRIEMNIIRGDVPTKEEAAAVAFILDLLTLPIDKVALGMQQSMGGDFEKFKAFNAAIAAAKSDPNIIGLAEDAVPSWVTNPTTREKIISQNLEQFSRSSVAKRFPGLSIGNVPSTSKLSAIESAIATPTYGPRVQNPPTVVGQIGDNIQGGPTNMSIPGNFNTPFDPAAMLK